MCMICRHICEDCLEAFTTSEWLEAFNKELEEV